MIRGLVWTSLACLAAAVLFFAYSYPVTETRRGRVVDQQGRPIPGARVMMTAALHDLFGERHVRRVSVKAGPDGAFEATLKWRADFGGEPGRFLPYHIHLEACHRDFVPAERDDAVGARPADSSFALAPRPKDKADFPWEGTLRWDDGINKDCRLALSWH